MPSVQLGPDPPPPAPWPPGLIGLAKTAALDSAKSDDIAAAGLFLLADEAPFISGDTLSIDGADCAKWA